jgi:hypothetical protein
MFCGITGGSVFNVETSYVVCDVPDEPETPAASFARAGATLS